VKLIILRGMDTLTVTRTTHLEAPAASVWQAVRSPRTFVTVTRGLLRLPVVESRTDEWQQGEEVVGWTWLFGVLPFNRHHLTVARIDHDRMILTSDEHGGLIRSWVHDIVVEPLGEDRCRYTDRVVIDAGWATLPVTAFAWLFYRVRQRRWRELARQLADSQRRSTDG
jgi:ligand-binding SRPBCC domain-containing protein